MDKKTRDALLLPDKASRDSYYYLSFRNPISTRSALRLERLAVYSVSRETARKPNGIMPLRHILQRQRYRLHLLFVGALPSQSVYSRLQLAVES